MAFMAGFGGFANFLLFDTTIPFQDFNYCKIYNQKWNYTSRNYTCSGTYKGGIYKIGSEKGDSGGPLMIQGSNHARWFVVGAIVSSVYPDNSHGDCSHMVSTRISFYCDWIEEKTDGDAKCIDMDDNYEIYTKRPQKVLASQDLHCNASCTRYFDCIANGGKYCTYAKGECNCDYHYWKDTFRSCLPPSCREACSYNGDCDYWCRLCQIKISDEEKSVSNDENCVGLEKGKMIRCGCLPVSCRNKCHEGECSYWCGLCEKE